MHRLALCLVIVASTVVAPRPAAAAATDVYDAVDAVELINNDSTFSTSPSLTLTAIPAGGTTPITRTYGFNGGVALALDTAMQCQRLAVVAMSKPGKFQFAIGTIGSNFVRGCKLIVRAP